MLLIADSLDALSAESTWYSQFVFWLSLVRWQNKCPAILYELVHLNENVVTPALYSQLLDGDNRLVPNVGYRYIHS